MSLSARIDKLAKAAVLIDPDHPPGLVALREQFLSIVETENQSGEEVDDLVHCAADLLESILLREIDDVDAAVHSIHESVEYLQSVADGATQPESNDADTVDEELLGSWIGECADSLNSIEESLLNLESNGADEEQVAEVRRRIHTLKGECGVLSLGTAQELCHEAETRIDQSIDRHETFPTNEILALVDWMRDYSSRLADDCNAAAPEYAALLSSLSEANAEAEAEANVPQTESAVDSIADADSGSTHEPDFGLDAVVNIDEAAVSEDTSKDDLETTEVEATDANEPIELPLGQEQDETLNEFICEAREHLTNAEAALLELENNNSDIELINTVFRAFHTIKGVAGFMNLAPIVELAHNAEFLLDKARSGSITLTSSYLDLALSSCDLLAKMIGGFEGGAIPSKGELSRLIAHLEKALSGEPLDKIETPSPEPEPVIAPTQSAPEQAVETQPSEQPGDDSKPQGEATASEAPKPEPAQKSAASRVKAMRKFDQTVKVNMHRLDNLVDMVGELVIAQQMVVQDGAVQQLTDQRTKRNLVHVVKIIRDLQEVAMSLRMVTLKGTFQKMARLVRDVSSKAGKKINFKIEGEDTELDRNVVEEIGDPLVHMIRNACDHGIGSAAERVAAGKPAEGTLTLRAFHKGGSINIEVEDDGKGLNRERILKKAIERELISTDRNPSDIPDSEVYNLIFLPGFSTAEKVTNISGRGVGMDVVRRNIEALRGKTEIQSIPGKGSVFSMRLPLTMAIIDGMVVRVGVQRYVIPTLSIEQSFRPAPNQLTTVVGRGELAKVRGSLLPIYRLNQLFSLNEGAHKFDESLLIVLESNNTRCCLLVDEILGQQQVVIKTLGQGLGSVRGVSGGAILGDGRVALILDVAGIFAEATGSVRAAA